MSKTLLIRCPEMQEAIAKLAAQHDTTEERMFCALIDFAIWAANCRREIDLGGLRFTPDAEDGSFYLVI